MPVDQFARIILQITSFNYCTNTVTESFKFKPRLTQPGISEPGINVIVEANRYIIETDNS